MCIAQVWLVSCAVPVIAKPFDTTKEEYATPYFPFPVHKDPSMHKMLTDVALGGAQAFQQSKRSDRMSQHVLLRIDIALTRVGKQVGSLASSARAEVIWFAVMTSTAS